MILLDQRSKTSRHGSIYFSFSLLYNQAVSLPQKRYSVEGCFCQAGRVDNFAGFVGWCGDIDIILAIYKSANRGNNRFLNVDVFFIDTFV